MEVKMEGVTPEVLAAARCVVAEASLPSEVHVKYVGFGFFGERHERTVAFRVARWVVASVTMTGLVMVRPVLGDGRVPTRAAGTWWQWLRGAGVLFAEYAGVREAGSLSRPLVVRHQECTCENGCHYCGGYNYRSHTGPGQREILSFA